MKKTCFIVILNFCFFTCVCQTKIYPTHWWAQMKNPELQIMMHGKNIGNADAYTINYPGVKLVKVNKVENPDYVFLDLVISSSAKPGRFTVNVQASENLKIKYELKPRRSGKSVSYAKGVYSNDLLYLIMPDRFSNGDTSNDRVPGMRDQSLNRDSIYDRHGGDLKGIENHLDYLQSIGVTALWLNPVIENDMPSRTEHGYAFTDHYRIDPRLGGEAAYRSLIDKVHQHHACKKRQAVV